MSLRLAASLGTAQSVASLVLGLISIKVTSVFLGPSGLATLGQLTYFMALAHGALSAGLHTGLVRRTAELGLEDERRSLVIATVLRLVLYAGLPAALLIAIAHRWLARELLHDSGLAVPFLVFSAVFVCGVVATIMMACASGAKDYTSVAVANIAGAVISCGLMILLCPLFGLLGGLIALAALPAFSLAVAWVLARRHAWWPPEPLAHGFSAVEARTALSFLPMAIVGTVGAPLLQLMIRDDVALHSGLSVVGHLQGVMRLSDAYMGVVSSVFVMYYFPRFSELKDPRILLRELGKGLVIVGTSMALVGLLIFLLRDWLVRMIFTPEFLPMRDLFAFQMTGNTFRMIGTLCAYLLLSKVSAFWPALLEATTMVVWGSTSHALVASDGALGATKAYAATYAIYALVTPVLAYVVLRRLGGARS